jgi:hypothetical protein
MRFALLLWTLLPGCPGSGDTAPELPPFCVDLSDGDVWRYEGQGGGSTSGTFAGHLVTDATADFQDAAYVGNVTYTVENVDVGGTTQENGRTSSSGTFDGSGAAGTWLFKAGSVEGGHTCSAETEFEVEAGRNTVVCSVLRCEE